MYCKWIGVKIANCMQANQALSSQVEAHIDVCSECRDVYKEQKLLSDLLAHKNISVSNEDVNSKALVDKVFMKLNSRSVRQPRMNHKNLFLIYALCSFVFVISAMAYYRGVGQDEKKIPTMAPNSEISIVELLANRDLTNMNFVIDESLFMFQLQVNKSYGNEVGLLREQSPLAVNYILTSVLLEEDIEKYLY